MVDPNDVRGAKAARSELSRRGIDISRADVRVRNGVCTIRGLVSRIGSADGGIMADLNIIAKVMRQKSEIKEVVLEVSGNGL